MIGKGLMGLSGTQPGQATIREITTQTEAWMEALLNVEAIAKDLRRALYDTEEVLFVGCGSAYHAALVATPLYRQVTGGRARAAQGGELCFYPQSTLPDPSTALVVAMSRSGQTTETVEACQRAKAQGAKIAAITCYAQSALASLADFPIILERAQEASVMTTRSFTAMVVACQALAGHAANDAEYLGQTAGLIPWGQAALDNYGTLGELLGLEENLEHFAFAAAAPLHGYALECQLKTREGSQLPAETVELFEHRHSRLLSADPTLHVTLLSADNAQAQEYAFLQEMKASEARVLLVCDSTDHPGAALADETMDVQSGHSEFVRGPLYMPMLQLMAAHRAVLVGYNPDAPDRLAHGASPASG